MIIIDRIEGTTAVVETPEGMRGVPLSAIEGEPHDGDVLVTSCEGGRYVIDRNATAARRERITAKRHDLFGKGACEAVL